MVRLVTENASQSVSQVKTEVIKNRESWTQTNKQMDGVEISKTFTSTLPSRNRTSVTFFRNTSIAEIKLINKLYCNMWKKKMALKVMVTSCPVSECQPLFTGFIAGLNNWRLYPYKDDWAEGLDCLRKMLRILFGDVVVVAQTLIWYFQDEQVRLTSIHNEDPTSSDTFVFFWSLQNYRN